MKIAEVFNELSEREMQDELVKKRFACASCGSTWVELVGLVTAKRSGNEDLCLRIGLESDGCQTCMEKSRICQDCGSKDTYEVRFAREIAEVPLNYRSIKTLYRVSGR